MITVALVGESGTGKSYHSIWLAGEKGIDYIIDDGILINRNKIVAGISAKKAATRIGAVKRAIFESQDERAVMRAAIERENPSGILVLGTSIKMVTRIKNALGLPEYSEIVRIEDIAAKEDIEKARLIRESQGKHVIPVPVMEIKRTFSGYFMDPMSLFRKTPRPSDGSEDKSIVRPSYSYIGDFEINDTVLCDIARYEALKSTGVYRVNKAAVEKTDSGVSFNLELVMYYGMDLCRCAREAAESIKLAIEKYAAIYTDNVNISIIKIVCDNTPKG